MRFAHLEVAHGQSSARSSVTLGRDANPVTGSAGFETCEFSRLKKRGRRRLASAVWFCPLAQAELLASTPCFAREELSIRHETLFGEAR
jgi:hypothetical protein